MHILRICGFSVGTYIEVRLISAAMPHDFAMNALLALSASDLAWQTQNSDTDNLAFHHRAIALNGLHDAIGDFSRENSEAILAASILLSWQATEWYDPHRHVERS